GFDLCVPFPSACEFGPARRQRSQDSTNPLTVRIKIRRGSRGRVFEHKKPQQRGFAGAIAAVENLRNIIVFFPVFTPLIFFKKSLVKFFTMLQCLGASGEKPVFLSAGRGVSLSFVSAQNAICQAHSLSVVSGWCPPFGTQCFCRKCSGGNSRKCGARGCET